MANDESNKVTYQVNNFDESQRVKELFNDTEELLQFGTWEWEPSTGSVSWSDGMYRIMGYEKDAVEGLVSDDFYLAHLDHFDADELRHIRSNAVNSKSPFEYTYRVKTHDNRERVITTKMKFITDETGRVVKGVGINRDVTEKTSMLRDLLHYKKMVMQKEEFLNLGTWELDLETNILTWSDGMFQLLGYTPLEENHEIDLFEFYRQHLSVEDLKKTNNAFHGMVEKSETYIRQSAVTTKNGTIKTIESFGKVQKDADNKPLKILGITRDVTKLKEYEQELEIKVEELNRSNLELEEFAYVASHDLQEPLRKLSTFGERLLNRCGDQLSEEGIVYLNRMMASAESMRVLIDNLLEFSRITRIQHPFEKVDMGALVRSVLDELDLSIEDSQAKITVYQLPAIDIMPIQMKQLFHNLISNAVKFRRPGGSLRITVKGEKLGKVEKELLKLRVSKTYYKISVIDNGIGFDEVYAERIFQLFQRLHGRTEYPGSGIGLAICRKIADNHHGLIMGSSGPAHGATFTVILPEKQTT